MSEEQLKAFIEQAKTDKALQEQLKVAKTNEEVVAIAKSAGFEVSVDELAKASEALTDDELEQAAAGGKVRFPPTQTYGCVS